MLFKIIFFISLSAPGVLFGQSVLRDSTASDLFCLTENSVSVAVTYLPSLLLDSCAIRLVYAKNDSVNRKLADLMQEGKMVLPLHVILTRRHHISSSLSEHFQYKNDSLTAVRYTYNKLEWTVNSSTREISISQKSINKCQTYWRKKISRDKKD
jgi:hypothetical protein